MPTPPLLSTILQSAALAFGTFDGVLVDAQVGARLDFDALVDLLEHAAALAAEHEYSDSHGTATSDYRRDWATAYPPLVRLLAKAFGGDA